ncbi:polysaccharide biosynthesis/export family protein [Mariniblastus sp.]|nr:polysaccharide biosynthesis/export family protein [Mariniblastus sp.]
MSFKTTPRVCIAALALCISFLAGCRSYGPTDLVPAADVLNRSCCQPDTEEQINFLKLRRSPPEQYVLGKGDVLGIYIQGITGDAEVPPPVNFADQDNNKPAIGYPVPIRDDGYISLPLIAPIRVTGLTVGEAEAKIVRAYTQDKKILLEGNEKIIVTLMQRRTYNVLVIREDGATSTNSQNGLNRNSIYLDEGLKTESFSIELPAYENDVLHALSETGGMPGESALNELIILRGAMNGGQDSGAIVQAVGAQYGSNESLTLEGANVVRIPIRGEAGTFPQITEADITLEDGDVVFIKGRQRDVFYTGGLLEGGRFPLPRDYDIDVLEAMAMAGGSVSATAGSGGNSGFSGLGSILPATQVTVLRKCGCEQVAIDVDLRYALSEPCERVIVQPGDLIILEYRKNELITNSIASIFQFGGIFNLFR